MLFLFILFLGFKKKQLLENISCELWIYICVWGLNVLRNFKFIKAPSFNDYALVMTSTYYLWEENLND